MTLLDLAANNHTFSGDIEVLQLKVLKDNCRDFAVLRFWGNLQKIKSGELAAI